MGMVGALLVMHLASNACYHPEMEGFVLSVHTTIMKAMGNECVPALSLDAVIDTRPSKSFHVVVLRVMKSLHVDFCTTTILR